MTQDDMTQDDMTRSVLPFIKPSNGCRSPLIRPSGLVTLIDQGNCWGGALVAEEVCFTQSYEIGECALAADTLSLILDATPEIERMADSRWHFGRKAPGSVMLTPARMPFAGRWRQGGFRVFNLSLSPGHVARAVPEAIGMTLPSRLELGDAQVARLLFTLRTELAGGCSGGRLFGEGLATALTAHLLAHYAVQAAKPKQYSRGLGKADLSRVLALIHERLAEDLSLDDLAACVHLSLYHFCHLFKQSTGQSPHQYLIAQRIENAKTLLIRGGLTVGEVAQAVGFSDQSHFQRHFKRIVGITPGQFSKR